MSRSPRSSRLPAGTLPGLVVLAVLVLLAVALWRSADPGGGDDNGGQAAADTQQQQADYSHAERRDPDDPFAMGPVDAPVGLVMFTDYQCPFCAQWSEETLPSMVARAEHGDLRIEIRDVNVYGPDSERASLAAYAAAQQDSYWDFHDALFEGGRHRSGSELSEEALVGLAVELGMDREQFLTDMHSPEAAEEIDRNEQLGVDHGAMSTPVFLLGGRPMVGAQPPEVFLEAYDAALEANGG